ncbi:conjugal transfer protein TraN [Poseidonibacter ostreae]|uniref:C-type lectin domain-containing protein n=1 Tax=Poseidonibacter ostreae TaxID=2654171 RepID=A0A6L4WPW6_9BACT|nr:conjugal transfer protein TraN [Poseidonibacter ostreae]KAB7885208.1 hypothetical protein GA417_09255 [Poseidonibacter ostreae]KAB7886061.1 hypothetical protein GBG19_12925 [Poseidonibacter ostreae]KAB7889618.1 hypothetical protein GBG18_10720 [Poseidonibacter ostreae]
MKRILFILLITYMEMLSIDCNSISSVEQYNNHYYAKTYQRTSYEVARISAINENGYLAIPNDSGENEFIRKLVGGNTEAWIGILDPNNTTNYCYDNSTCAFNDSRFKDVLNNGLTFKKWANLEPNNYIEASDIEDGKAVVDPLGENWVIINGNNGEWHDVGNHKSSNQNPRKHISVIEFDTKPSCFFEDDGVSETDFDERVCNTKVFDDNIANASEGIEAKCLFDINGKEYCPQDLAPADWFWSYIDGESVETVSTVTDYAQGEYQELTTTVRDFANSDSSTQNTGTVVDYDNGESATYTGVVTDYTSMTSPLLTADPIVLGAYTYNWWNCDSCGIMPIGYLRTTIRKAGGSGNSLSGGGVLNDSPNTIQVGINSSYINVSPGQIAIVQYKKVGNKSTGVYRSAGGKPTIRLKATTSCLNWGIEQGTKDYPTHKYCKDSGSNNYTSCPSGYQKGTNAVGQFYCYKDVYPCPSSYTIEGSVCKKDINFNYYSYSCPVGYTIDNQGFSTFEKTDPDGNVVNWVTLDDNVNEPTPPIGNCTKVIDYDYYTYGCEDGYTIVDEGLDTCYKTDNDLDGVSNDLANDCNNPIPPESNCYKDIDYNHYTYGCPADYAIANFGLDTCAKTDPNVTINNENTLIDSCNEKIPPVGNCSKNIDYSSYEYICTSEQNVFNEDYNPVNEGLKGCLKTDDDLINTNAELGDNCNDAESPVNNCKTTDYACNSEIREPVWLDDQWKCSPYPCYGNENVEDLSGNVGTLDKQDNGWTEDGKCDGEIYIFNGESQQCRSSDKFFGLAGGGCCNDDKFALGLLSCRAEEKELQIKKENEKCHYIGEYCSKKVNLGFSKICVRESKSYCCFNSQLGKLIAVQGREQLTDILWGSPENPNCRGFTIEEFQRLDLGQMDLSEFSDNITLPDVENQQNTIIQKVNSHMNLIKNQ